MEENRPQLRRTAIRFVLSIYLFFVLLAVISFFVLSDLENDGIVRNTQLERGLVTLVFLLAWSLVCFRLYRINNRIFDLRSQVFDAREAEHYATKEAARLREQFMANMSHEIRTPLNAIIGFTGLLSRAPLGERERELTNGIQSASENLITIVNDILDLSKIEAGMLLLEKIPFEPDGLFHSVQQMFVEKARQKNLSLDVHLAPGLPEQLVGDPTRLTQILFNLIGNAVKFTERGGIVISVVPVDQTPDKQATIRIEVRDSGIGIPAGQLERVFERFTQSDEQTTRIYGGTGLGLSIVKQLVQAMGGTIFVESELGKGSVFTVTLPFSLQIPANASEPEGKDNPDEMSTPELPVATEANLLIAEDNPMNQRVVELLFGEWKYNYTIVQNGREAVELLAKTPHAFDLVLLDIQMPEMDGYEATRQIRQTLRLDIPLVAMTAHALAGEREKCLRTGMNDYIAKPIREQELRNVIARFVRKTNDTPEPEIDRAWLQETTLGNIDNQRELAGIFLAQAPKDLDAMAAALSAADLTAATKAAHNMKSTVGYMGFAPSIGQLLAAFEEDCRNGKDLETLAAELQHIVSVVEKAKAVVRNEFGV